MLRWFIGIVAALLLQQCKSTKQAVPVQQVTCSGITLVKEYQQPDAATLIVDSAFVQKDDLYVLLRVKGCNRADAIQLVWNGVMMKSYPPRVSLKLMASKNGDASVATMHRLCFNLDVLRQGASTGKIYLDLDGTDRKFLYEY